MRKLFPFLLAFVFLFRGFVADAMAVAMMDADSPMKSSAVAAMPDTQSASCHDMGMMDDAKSHPGKSSSDHKQCQWCCVAAVIPAIQVLNFDAFASSPPVIFTPAFASNALLPAFKPPIL